MGKVEIDPKGLDAARRYAGWHLGDPAWANMIVRAYLNPVLTHEVLDEEDVPKVTGVFS